jgi:hypothetical protein
MQMSPAVTCPAVHTSEEYCLCRGVVKRPSVEPRVWQNGLEALLGYARLSPKMPINEVTLASLDSQVASVVKSIYSSETRNDWGLCMI